MGEPCVQNSRITEDIAVLKENQKTLFRAIDEHGKALRGVHTANATLEVVKTEMQQFKDLQLELKAKVEELTAKPGKNWELVITAIISLVVALLFKKYI